MPARKKKAPKTRRKYGQKPARGTELLLTFKDLLQAHRERDRAIGKELTHWTPGDWGATLVGEIGETFEVLEVLMRLGTLAKIGDTCKKLRRIETAGVTPGSPSLHHLKKALGSELADLIHCAVLVAEKTGIDLEYEVLQKFNEVSIRRNLPHRLVGRRWAL